MTSTEDTEAPPAGATVEGAVHHRVEVNGTTLHVVRAGGSGSPVLLVHGFPESWRVFHRLVPLLASTHRVVAVDLRGWGDSDNADGDYGETTVAEDLHQLVATLGLGPVHLVGQDIAGDAVFRLAAEHPEDLLSLTMIEVGLSGFGLEGFADVAHGGAWHFGAIATPGIADFVFAGRERDYLERLWFPAMTRVPGAIEEADLDELVRVFSRPDAWRGAYGLYSSALADGDALKALAERRTVDVPVLAVNAMSNPFTRVTLEQAVGRPVESVYLDGVGHHVALEAPERLAGALLDFVDRADADRDSPSAARSD